MIDQDELCERIADTLRTAPIHDHLGYEALAYLKLPGPNYLELLRSLHLSLEPKLYVEIGVRAGDSLKQARPETRVIGIDPAINYPAVGERPNTVLASATSDEFFSIAANRDKCRGFDLAFIDGDHSFEQALRDFENLEALAKPSSIICLHDVIPMDERTSRPKPEGASFHTGDVWRLMCALVKKRKDLVAFTVATPPTGLGIVGKFGNGPADFTLYPWDRAEFTSEWFIWARDLNIVPNTREGIRSAFNRGQE